MAVPTPPDPPVGPKLGRLLAALVEDFHNEAALAAAVDHLAAAGDPLTPTLHLLTTRPATVQAWQGEVARQITALTRYYDDGPSGYVLEHRRRTVGWYQTAPRSKPWSRAEYKYVRRWTWGPTRIRDTSNRTVPPAEVPVPAAARLLVWRAYIAYLGAMGDPDTPAARRTRQTEHMIEDAGSEHSSWPSLITTLDMLGYPGPRDAIPAVDQIALDEEVGDLMDFVVPVRWAVRLAAPQPPYLPALAEDLRRVGLALTRSRREPTLARWCERLSRQLATADPP